LHYTEGDDRSYLWVTRVPGQVLSDAWQTMDEDEKQHYVCRTVDICKELSAWRSEAITGIDGAEFPDTWLDLLHSPHNFNPQALQKPCSELGMDCSTFYFWHSDLGPYNIVVNSGEKGTMGIIDWEMAAFVPRAWIRTKVGVSWAMDFAWPEVHGDDPSLREWRERVEQKFGEEGYPEVKAAWNKWLMDQYSPPTEANVGSLGKT